jgi:CDP-diglyceride synthetase
VTGADGTDLVSRLASLAEDATRAFGVRVQAGEMGKYLRAIVFGIAMALFGQLGDLFESCFKRDAGAKDSAQLIPRFGGILDLIDSPLLTIPIAWFLFVAVWGLF